MLEWARRYLAATPAARRRGFALGMEFRRIVGARNREHWWTTGVWILEGRLGLRPAGVRPRVYRRAAADVVDASDRVGAVRESEAPPAYGTGVKTPPRIIWPKGTAEDRLRAFDAAMERADRRARGEPANPEYRPPKERGWTREEIYDRDRRD